MRRNVMALFFCLILTMASSVSLAAGSGNVLKEGDKGKDVIEIQTKLKQKGYAVAKVTGVFTTETTRAVREFQKKQGIRPADGIVEATTYRKLLGKEIPSRTTPSEDHSLARKITDKAQQFIGVPYKFGGISPKGFDCSGFVWYVFHENGKNLPRTADVQFMIGKSVFQSDLKRGDLVFFTTYQPGPSHCGIYLEAGKFIHASSSRGIMISKLDDYYWKPRYIGAKRVI